MNKSSWRMLALVEVGALWLLWHGQALAYCEVETRNFCATARILGHGGWGADCDDAQGEKRIDQMIEEESKRPDPNAVALFRKLAKESREDAAKSWAKVNEYPSAAKSAKHSENTAVWWDCRADSTSRGGRNNQGQTELTPNNTNANSGGNSAAQSSDPIVNQHAFTSLDAKKQKQLLADREKAGERKYRNMSDCVDYKNGYKGKASFQHWMVNRCNVKVTYTFCWSGPGKHTCEDADYGMWQIRPGGSDPFSGPPTYQGTKGDEYTIHYAACEYPGGALNRKWQGPGKGFSFDCK